MGDIKRYDCGNGEGMFDDKLGEWVFYEDHKTLLEAKDRALNIDNVSKRNAKGYAEFCVICDRGKLPLLELDDYIKHYGC